MKQPITRSHGLNKRQLVFDYSIFGVTIKKGLIFDGASFPKFIYRWFRPFEPQYEAMAVVHDAIYTGWTLKADNGTVLTRKRADSLLLLILKKNGVNSIKSNIIYFGVRAFGWMFKK